MDNLGGVKAVKANYLPSLLPSNPITMANFYDPPNTITQASIVSESIDDAVTTVGTIQVGAYPVTKAYTIASTVLTGATAAILPVDIGAEFVIKNNGTASILAFPPVGAAYDGGSVNAASTITTGATGGFLCVSATRFIKVR